MVVTRVNLKFFYLKNVLPRVKLTFVLFNLVSLFEILIQFSLPIF